MIRSLEKRVLIFSFLILTFTIVLSAGFDIQSFHRSYRDSVLLRLESLAGGLRNSVEKVLALGIPLREMDGLNVRCQEIVATDPEIIYCLVEDLAGTPLFSNDPSFHSSAGARPVDALNPTTTLMILPRAGKVYDVALPVRAADGETVGRVRVGFPTRVLRDMTLKVLFRSLVLLGLLCLLVFGVVALFARRHLITPIEHLCRVSQEISRENFQVAVPPMMTREFRLLGDALQEMAHALRVRDEKIVEGYRELEETNLLLQESYERQERISSELGQNREMYQSLLENASDAIVVSDEEDNVILVNRQAEEFFGFDREEVVGENLLHVFARLQCSDLDQLYSLYQETLEGGTPEAELRYMNLSHQRPVVGWVRTSLVRGIRGGRLIQAIIRDVTGEREIKDNLERSAQELRRLNQMKDSFLGLISHELKTPLTIILGYADLILNQIPDKVDSSVLPMVENIANAGERLNRVVQDMVDISMIDGRRLQVNLQEVEVNSLVETVAAETAVFLEKRRQSLHLELATDLPLIQGDPDRLLQMITNLVNNAIKFTPDDGRIILQTRYLPEPEPAAGEGSVELVVRDTGIGIPDDDRERVFEKFYGIGKIEEHSTGQISFKGKGAGLGLAIVQGIVSLHGGEVWVESGQPDESGAFPGAAFHVRLPVNYRAS